MTATLRAHISDIFSMETGRVRISQTGRDKRLLTPVCTRKFDQSFRLRGSYPAPVRIRTQKKAALVRIQAKKTQKKHPDTKSCTFSVHQLTFWGRLSLVFGRSIGRVKKGINKADLKCAYRN